MQVILWGGDSLDLPHFLTLIPVGLKGLEN